MVAEGVWAADQTIERRDVDDGGIAGLEQFRRGSLHAKEHTGLVDSDYARPALLGFSFHAAGMENTCIVDEIGKLPKRGDRQCDGGLPVAQVGYIEPSESCLTAFCGDLLDDSGSEHFL